MSVIQVKVRLRSSESLLELLEDGTYVARLKSPPIDGRANAELIALVAKRFAVSKSAVSIKSGASARLKLLVIAV